MRWQLQGVSYIVSKQYELWPTNGFKLDRHFYPPYTWILSTSLPGFADGHQQTELNQTLPNGGRYVALATCRRNFGVVPREKIGGQKTLHLFGLSTTLRLNGEYLLNETIGQTRWKVRMDSYIVLKFHKHWSTNGSKPDRSFYPPSLFCFCLLYTSDAADE